MIGLNIYVPRDENFGHLKMGDFLGYALKALSASVKPGLQTVFDITPGEFDNYKEVHNLYEGGFPIPQTLFKHLSDSLSAPLLKEVLRIDGDRFLRFAVPDVIKGTDNSFDNLVHLRDSNYNNSVFLSCNLLRYYYYFKSFFVTKIYVYYSYS